VEGWGGQKVIPRPSADYFVVGRRPKSHERLPGSASKGVPHLEAWEYRVQSTA
jgi:hypothetical protein